MVLNQNNSVLLQSRIKKAGIVLKSSVYRQLKTQVERADLEIV
jgi:hypothetical protein